MPPTILRRWYGGCEPCCRGSAPGVDASRRGVGWRPAVAADGEPEQLQQRLVGGAAARGSPDASGLSCGGEAATSLGFGEGLSMSAAADRCAPRTPRTWVGFTADDPRDPL